MPMDRNDYPDNWEEIAKSVKDEANWTCQHCGKPCRRPGMSWWEFVESLGDSKWYDQTFEEISNDIGESGIVEKKQRFTLTVSHINHNPLDCRRENLRALCSVCHLRYDAPHHANSRRIKKRQAQEENGQLSFNYNQ